MARIIRKFIFKVVAPVILLVTPFILPIHHFTFDIQTLLTTVSFVFAILVGFFIATATTNYLRLESLIANEDSALISIFNLARVIQPSKLPQIREAIDNYATFALDFELTEYVEKTQKEFSNLLASLDDIRPQDNTGVELYGNIHDKKDQLIRTRQEVTFAARRIVTVSHWIVLILLSVLLITLLFSLRDGHWLFSSITGILSSAIYLILILLYEIDGNIFLEEQLAYENTQQIFQTIGTMKYIPYHAFQNKRVKEPKEDYRIGIFKNYPYSLEREIRVVRKNP